MSGVGGEVHIDSLSVEEAWTRLSQDAGSVLVDVRTSAEWAFVGLPDLTSIGRQPVLIEWQEFPASRLNQAFVTQLTEALTAIGANKETELFFLCRSGGRSLSAARAMTAAGYTRCRNVADGFEGPLDPNRHRGSLGGWKAKGLPWAQG
ncbi:MAG TPA: rhodanese-like domain-containing protein [Hyphomicrobiaceae bacterium]|nr:rhodanese-like domain-containing protein [Hyphomicrobiaceae bacterium]